MKKLISFSLNKDSIILEYLNEDKEVIAVIEPYTFCTYLVDLEIIEDREKEYPFGVKVWLTKNMSVTWKTFIVITVRDKVFTDELLEGIIDRHIQTEMIKQAFHTSGNHNFSFN